jgi:hypothetical protein
VEHGEKGKSQTKKQTKKNKKITQMDYIFMPKVHLPAKKKMTENIFVPTSIARFYYCYFFLHNKKTKFNR